MQWNNFTKTQHSSHIIVCKLQHFIKIQVYSNPCMPVRCCLLHFTIRLSNTGIEGLVMCTSPLTPMGCTAMLSSNTTTCTPGSSFPTGQNLRGSTGNFPKDRSAQETHLCTYCTSLSNVAMISVSQTTHHWMLGLLMKESVHGIFKTGLISWHMRIEIF